MRPQTVLSNFFENRQLYFTVFIVKKLVCCLVLGCKLIFRATKVKEIRNKSENVLLLDAGDQFQGNLWLHLYKEEAIAKVMKHIGYDAMVSLFAHWYQLVCLYTQLPNLK